jgi:hypothetical protein
MSLHYRDGQEVRIGDHVDYDGEPSVVEDLVDTEAKRLEWGLQCFGLLLTNRAFGRVFVPPESVELVARDVG